MATVRTRPDPRKLSDDELELFRAFHVMRRGFDRTLDAQLQQLADQLAQMEGARQSLQAQYDETSALLAQLVQEHDQSGG